MKISSDEPIVTYFSLYSQWNIEEEKGRKRKLFSKRKWSRDLQKMQNSTDITKMVLVTRIQWLSPLILELPNHEASSPLDSESSTENWKDLSMHQPPEITNVIVLKYVFQGSFYRSIKS